MRRLAAEGNLDILPDRSRQEAEIGSDQRRGRAAPAEQDFSLSAPGEVSSCQVHETVTARLIAENEHFIVYEYATSAPLQHVRRTIDFYSDHGAEVIERYFGGVSDVNGDGTVTILIRPELEGRTAYVWSADMTLTQEQCAASNEMELMHVEVEAFEAFDDDRYWALAGVVHEMVHVSSLYKRVRGHVRRGGTGERFHPTWIEEGRAEIAKEAASRLAWERLGGPAFTARIKGEMIHDALRAGGTRRAAVWGTQSNHAGFNSAVAFELAAAFFEDAMEPAEEAGGEAGEGEFDPDDYDPEDFEDFDDFVGRYALDETPSFILTFTREDDTYFAQPTDQPRLSMVPTSDSTFAISRVDPTIIFHRSEDGTVSSMTLDQNGLHPATRLPEEDTSDPAALADFEGRYFSNEVETFYDIVLEDGELVMKQRRLDDATLVPAQRDTFSGGGFTFRFERDRNDQVIGFYLSSGRTRDVRFGRVR